MIARNILLIYFFVSIIKRQVMPDQSYDLFASVRQCGGPHTLTVPHKKLLKIPQPLAEDPVIQQQQQQAAQIPHPVAAKQ